MEGLPLVYSGDDEQTQKFSSKVFHTVNRILPENQEVLTVSPDMEAQKAIRLMVEKGFSQVPVLEGTLVLGIFSFRSFAQGAVNIECKDVDLRKLPVDNFIERVPFVRINDDEYKALCGHIDRKGAVLVGEESVIRGIITFSDIIDYLYKIADPYFLLYEIEHGLRELIRLSVNNDELKECMMRSLAKGRGEKSLEELFFSEYGKIITNQENWDYFVPVFGNSRERTSARLDGLNTIRNLAFHFARELSIEEHQRLADWRYWIWINIKRVETRRKGGIND